MFFFRAHGRVRQGLGMMPFFSCPWTSPWSVRPRSRPCSTSMTDASPFPSSRESAGIPPHSRCPDLAILEHSTAAVLKTPLEEHPALDVPVWEQASFLMPTP